MPTLHYYLYVACLHYKEINMQLSNNEEHVIANTMQPHNAI